MLALLGFAVPSSTPPNQNTTANQQRTEKQRRTEKKKGIENSTSPVTNSHSRPMSSAAAVDKTSTPPTPPGMDPAMMALLGLGPSSSAEPNNESGASMRAPPGFSANVDDDDTSKEGDGIGFGDAKVEGDSESNRSSHPSMPISSSPQILPPSTNWSEDEQRLLNTVYEAELKRGGRDLSKMQAKYRWQRVARRLKGRTAQECRERVQWCESLPAEELARLLPCAVVQEEGE